MSENKQVTDAEIKERGAALQAGITELSDDDVDAVAGGTGGTKSFQSMALEDTPARPHSVWKSCYKGCQLPPESRSLWARSVAGSLGSTKIDVKCYSCGMLYDFISNADEPDNPPVD